MRETHIPEAEGRGGYEFISWYICHIPLPPRGISNSIILRTVGCSLLYAKVSVIIGIFIVTFSRVITMCPFYMDVCGVFSQGSNDAVFQEGI